MTTKANEEGGGTFKYPYYPLNAALKIAEAVKDLGGARTPVKKSLLAKQLGAVENAAAFAQGLSSARVFGAIDGRGDSFLTESSKKYFFPTTESDKSWALLEMFAAPSAFSELLRRFDGDKLPSRQILSNILHRDLGIPESWMDRVAGLFTSSAQSVGVIDSQGILRYNATRHSSGGSTPLPLAPPNLPPQDDEFSGANRTREQPRKSPPPSAPGGAINSWSYEDIVVHTPKEMTMELWDRLNAYVTSVLKPKS